MKKILAILGGMALSATTAGSVIAASKPVQVYSLMPTNCQFVISDDQKSMTVSFQTKLLLWNNKPFPSISNPDLNLSATKPSQIIPEKYNGHEEGFGFRLSATLPSTDNFYGDRIYSPYDTPVHEWWQASFVYNYDKTVVWYAKALGNLNLRNEEVSLINSADNNLLDKNLSDEDASQVSVDVAASFVIDLPDVPFMLNVSLGGWVIDNLLTDVHEEDEGKEFRVWLPSKPVTSNEDANNVKVTGRIGRNS